VVEVVVVNHKVEKMDQTHMVDLVVVDKEVVLVLTVEHMVILVVHILQTLLVDLAVVVLVEQVEILDHLL
jgi:hypothetical protein